MQRLHTHGRRFVVLRKDLRVRQPSCHWETSCYISNQLGVRILIELQHLLPKSQPLVMKQTLQMSGCLPQNFRVNTSQAFSPCCPLLHKVNAMPVNIKGFCIPIPLHHFLQRWWQMNCNTARMASFHCTTHEIHGFPWDCNHNFFANFPCSAFLT